MKNSNQTLKNSTSEFCMTIDGKKVAGEQFFDVINPATGQVFTEAPECTENQLNMAMEAAKKAFQSWRLDEAKRRQVLLDCAKVVREHSQELAELQEILKKYTKMLSDIAGVEDLTELEGN